MLVVVVGIAGYLYMKQAAPVTTIGSNPQTTVEMTAVRNDLLALANAERQYFASHGKYVSLGELRTDGGIAIPTRPNFSFSAETTESTFKISAVYTGPDPKAPKRLTINENMALTNE
jgi:hypothetical protein